jgi:hypothetical protein
VKTPEDLKSATVDMMKATGAQSCTTAGMSAEAKASVMGGLGEAGVKVQASATSGCEQIAALAQSFKQSTDAISCIIGKSTQSISADTSAVNSISFEIGGDFFGGESNETSIAIEQGIIQRIVDIKQMSVEQKAAIANVVDTFNQQAAQVGLNSKTEAGATPQGQKAITDIATKISNSNAAAQVNDTISEIVTTVSAGNNVLFKVGGNFYMPAKGFTSNQNILQDITAAAILTNSMSADVKNMFKAINLQDTKVDTKSDNKGFTPLELGGISTGVIVAVIIVVVLVVIIPPLLKKKEAGAAVSKTSSALSTAASSVASSTPSLIKAALKGGMMR